MISVLRCLFWGSRKEERISSLINENRVRLQSMFFFLKKKRTHQNLLRTSDPPQKIKGGGGGTSFSPPLYLPHLQ